MTRDEALLHGKEQLEIFGGEHREFIEMAIKALEQEPVLDKIRADVQNGTHHFLDGEPIIEIKEVLQIIDKYRQEG